VEQGNAVSVEATAGYFPAFGSRGDGSDDFAALGFESALLDGAVDCGASDAEFSCGFGDRAMTLSK
jgi:hypothetical protein